MRAGAGEEHVVQMVEMSHAPDGRTDGALAGITGMESPRQLADAMPMVERAFVFVDLCGFTGFMAGNGEHAAIEALNAFRNLTRDIATRRGVRIASWLGDGAMLIGTEVGPAIAAAAELIARYDASTLALRGGIADGWALLFDGDDYIGRPVNLAARLSQAARPGELLAIGYPPETFPSWMQVLGTRDLTLRGLGRFRRVQRLGLVPDTELPALSHGLRRAGSVASEPH
jgi:class 3 adenylate cyclase